MLINSYDIKFNKTFFNNLIASTLTSKESFCKNCGIDISVLERFYADEEDITLKDLNKISNYLLYDSDYFLYLSPRKSFEE